MSADKLNFGDNYFNVVLIIDTIDRLSNKELDKCLNQVSRILKKDGILFIKTCSNKTILNLTYKYYIQPMNTLITKIDKFIKGRYYESLPMNPRTKEQSNQHINEPIYLYLKRKFKKFRYEVTIDVEIGYLKEIKFIRTSIYNFFIAFYPFSLIPPLKYRFASEFICKLRNSKK